MRMICGFALLLVCHTAVADRPAVEGYADYNAMRGQLKAIAAGEFATLESLGTTVGRREVYLLSIGTGRLDEKPAVLIVGSVHAPHLAGSELAVRVARGLADEANRKLLDRVTFYVISRPAPDACEAFFRRPYFERSGNDRNTDDDRDGQIDEDGPDDLDGDGWITTLRVADPTGPYMPHPNDPRVLIEADPQRDEQGRYRIYVEGRDRDEDDEHGEDPAGGVAFNRNFTFRYPYFERGAGPHQVSEIETRAVADFAFSHPNIAAVVTFTPEDNLMQSWKPDGSSESKRIKTAVRSDDSPYFDFIAEAYCEIHGGENPPESVRGEGSFSEWAYFHYGRWSLGCRGWWIPQVAVEKEESDKDEAATEKPEEEQSEEEKSEEEKSEAEEPKEEKRGADEINALRWFDREKIDGFAKWKRIEHPDFPGKQVEVGGLRPFLQLNPPVDRLDPLAEKHGQFVRRLVELLPQVAIHETKAESLGGGVWRVTVAVVNRGYLPTMSQMGETTRQPHKLQIELQLPQGASLAAGHPRLQLPVLAGHGGKAEQTWLVVLANAKSATLRARVWSPSVGSQMKKITLAETKP